MKQVEKKLCSYIEKVEGCVLGIGITEDVLIDALNKNIKIEKCQFLNITSNENKKWGFSFRSISVKKLRRKFKKKKTDYIFCYTDEVMPFQRRFWKDSIYLTKKKIYFYGDKREDITDFINKYKRYGADIRYEYIGKCYIVIIDIVDCNTNLFMDLWYSIIDWLKYFYECLGDLFMN